jgi:hypothetical protein
MGVQTPGVALKGVPGREREITEERNKMGGCPALAAATAPFPRRAGRPRGFPR